MLTCLVEMENWRRNLEFKLRLVFGLPLFTLSTHHDGDLFKVFQPTRAIKAKNWEHV
jgi:hypothetical protein